MNSYGFSEKESELNFLVEGFIEIRGDAVGVYCKEEFPKSRRSDKNPKYWVRVYRREDVKIKNIEDGDSLLWMRRDVILDIRPIRAKLKIEKVDDWE